MSSHFGKHAYMVSRNQKLPPFKKQSEDLTLILPLGHESHVVLSD